MDTGNVNKAMTAEELLQRYAAGERDFTGANLYRANLTDVNLAGAHIEGADFTGADLTGAHLYGAYFVRANLEGANLEGANLEGANLEGANLEGANLEGANLFLAQLEGVYLFGADLEGAKILFHNRLVEIKKKGRQLMTHINFEFKNKYEMEAADLSGVKIDSVALTLDNDILWVLTSNDPATWVAVDDSNMTISCENFEKLKTRFEVSIQYRVVEFVCCGRNPGLKDGYGQSEIEAFVNYLIQNRWEPIQGVK